MPSRRAALWLALALALLALAAAPPAGWELPARAGAAGAALGLLIGGRGAGAGPQEAGGQRAGAASGIDVPTERGAPRQAGPRQSRYRLVAWDGDMRVEHELAERQCAIGRDPGCNLRLHNSWAAPLHARISLAGDRVSITDLDSDSGTFLGLGGPRLPAHHPTEIQEGDEVWIGPEVRVALRRSDAS